MAGLLLLPWVAVQAQQQQRSCWLRDIVAPTPSTVYAVCSQGGLWSTTDGGVKWQSSETKATARVKAMDFFDVNRGLLVGEGGMVMSTADAGKTWQTQAVPSREKPNVENLVAISLVGENAWLVGYQGTILHSADAGKTWEQQKSGTTQALENVYFLDAQHGWAIGWAGTVLRTVDGGKTWQQSPAGAATWSLNSVYFKDAQRGWMVGFGGQILGSTDGGITWVAKSSPSKGTLSAVAFDGKGQGWITQDDGFLVSKDGGETWTDSPLDGRFFLTQLAHVGDSLWAMGQAAVLRQTATGWERIRSLSPSGLDTESIISAATPNGTTAPSPR